MQIDQQAIVIVDSGVGGLSILKEIHQNLPERAVYCVADNAGYPYGTKTEQALIDRLDQLFAEIIERFNPALIVLGCNSASTTALPHLRGRFSVPIVGVVPAIKPAAEQSQSKVIGLLATTATVSRPYIDQLIAEFAPDCRVIRVGSQILVDQAEAYLRGDTVDHQRLQQSLGPLLEATEFAAVDQVVLGCTHFPLLSDHLQTLLPGIRLVDSGAAIAHRVTALIAANPLDTAPKAALKQKLRLYLTQPCIKQAALSGYLAGWLNEQISVLPLTLAPTDKLNEAKES